MYKRRKDHSKKLTDDVRSLLWIISIGGLALAFYCVHESYVGALPWISALVGLPWAAHATICAFYLEKAKAENTGADGNGIVYAKAFQESFDRVASIVSAATSSTTHTAAAPSIDVSEETSTSSLDNF